MIRQRWRADGGAERQVAQFLEHLGRRRCEATLIARGWSASDGYRVAECNPFAWGRLWREWSFSRGVQRMLTRSDFDWVQSHERIPGCDVYRAGDGVHGRWLQHKARIQGPIAQWWTVLHPYHRWVRRTERTMFEDPRLRAVVCNSRMVRDEILASFAIDAKKLHVIYNGVDTERFHPRWRSRRVEVRRRWDVPDEVPLFAFVGSGFERKGLAVALAALARLPDSRLLVVGKDKRTNRFQRLARRWGVLDRVRFAGLQTEVAPIYGAADALVLPTLYDPFPNVALEALASGLPAVVSSTCGAAELIREGENGFIRDALDVDGVADALRQIAGSPHRETMARAARAAAEPLDLPATRSRLIEFYEEVLGARIG